jgi:hypothetical protein
MEWVAYKPRCIIHLEGWMCINMELAMSPASHIYWYVFNLVKLLQKYEWINECIRGGPSWPLHRDHSDLLCLASEITLFYSYEEVRWLYKSDLDFIFKPLITTAK